MISYIYFVRCPECEAEPFDFFDEARKFAMQRLTQKPVITQTEVTRNDFGECTDSCELGTVWSWEEVMSDIPENDTLTTFTKTDTFGSAVNSEFDDDCLSELLDADIGSADPDDDNKEQLDELLAADTVKSIQEEMTIDELVEAMEANEDNYECFYCSDTCAKERVHTIFNSETKKDIHVCPDCYTQLFGDEKAVNCACCGDSLPENDCIYDKDLGWLCFKCEKAVISKEGKSAIERTSAPLDEDFRPGETVEFNYDFTVTIFGPKRAEDDWDEWEKEVNYSHYVPANDVAIDIWENFITEEDAANVEGGLEALEDDDAFNAFLAAYFDDLLEKYRDELHDYYRNAAEEACQEKANCGGYDEDEFDYLADYRKDESVSSTDPKKKPMLREWDEDDSISNSLLTLCPECGNNGFDQETGICITCGFN